jgi:divinyl protochlorophyllide a 8-vinyl-reductase
VSGAAPDQARIGPNAVTRLADALTAANADPAPVFARAGLEASLLEPPTAMVAEADVTALYAALHAELGRDDARLVGDAAGVRTATYLLANRIPRPAQTVLRACPAQLSQRLLLMLIAKHAWTFAGSAGFEVHHGRPAHIVLTGSPLARGITDDRPVCAFYAGTFRGLLRALVDPATDVVEVACAAAGAPHCRFEVRR